MYYQELISAKGTYKLMSSWYYELKGIKYVGPKEQHN